METERENIKEELTGQDVRKQSEGKAVSANEVCEEQNLEPEDEEESQAQSSDKVTTSHYKPAYTLTEVSHSCTAINSICIIWKTEKEAGYQ